MKDKQMTKLEKKFTKMFLRKVGDCGWSRSFIKEFLEMEDACLETVDRNGNLKALLKDLAKGYVKMAAERRKKFEDMPDTPVIGPNDESDVIQTGPDGNDYLMLPVTDFSPLWDYDSAWGSELFEIHDFSKDEAQNNVKATFAFSAIEEDLSNEVMWLTLLSSETDRDGRNYFAHLNNDSFQLDLKEAYPTCYDEEADTMRIFVPARALQCVFDNEAYKAKDDSNMYRRDPNLSLIHI